MGVETGQQVVLTWAMPPRCRRRCLTHQRRRDRRTAWDLSIALAGKAMHEWVFAIIASASMHKATRNGFGGLSDRLLNGEFRLLLVGNR